MCTPLRYLKLKDCYSTNKKIGSGALICLSKDILPLNSNTIILPVDMI
jgi:hypothetical protein